LALVLGLDNEALVKKEKKKYLPLNHHTPTLVGVWCTDFLCFRFVHFMGCHYCGRLSLSGLEVAGFQYMGLGLWGFALWVWGCGVSLGRLEVMGFTWWVWSHGVLGSGFGAGGLCRFKSKI
jgi:hypothetical protein